MVDAAAEGSAQLVVALPLSQSTLDSFVQGVNPANQAMLTLSAITQEEVGKVTSLSFRYYQSYAGTLWSYQYDATATSNDLSFFKSLPAPCTRQTGFINKTSS